MKIIKLMLLVVLGLVVGWGGLYYAASHGYLSAHQISTVDGLMKGLPIAVPALPSNSTAASASESGLSSQLTSSTAQAGAVLGESIQIESQEPPLHQRAFEYARYMYCQEVVRDYQSRYPEEQ